jgi:hypothetical protein
MDDLPLITTPIRELDGKLWAIFTKKGPLTAEEQAYLDRIEAEYEQTIFDEGEYN